jgi:hypothetical protein
MALRSKKNATNALLNLELLHENGIYITMIKTT